MTATAQSFTPEERREYIGCSEISAVMGLDRYRTPLDVYNDKLGLVAPFEGNQHTERGNRLEAIAAEYYTEKTGYKLRRHNEGFRMGYIAGHIDRMVVGEKRLVEIKCPSVAAFRRLQREGLPESYIVQAQAYMHLSGVHRLTWVIFCADLWDAAVFDIDYDEKLAETIMQAAEGFWINHVQQQIPPTDEKSGIEFEKIGGQDITKRDDPAFIESALKLKEAADLKRDAEELYELAKADVIGKVEDIPGVYECPGFRLHYTEQAGRKTLDKKAVAAAGIDLSPFEKQGKPFKTFKPYYFNQ